MRVCTGCGDVQPEQAFGWKDAAAGKRHTRCASCRAAYQRAWYARNAERHRAAAVHARRIRHARNASIVTAAKDVPCADCGERYRAEEMDFDHVRGAKFDNVASLVWHATAERLRVEISKCEVVCAVCHRLRTKARRSL